METPRPFALVRTVDQWLRSVHRGTSLRREGERGELGTVELAWETPTSAATGAAAPPAGLAFDRECRAYHSDPTGGVVERVRWAAELAQQTPEPILRASEGSLRHPGALAVDAEDRLFVAEAEARRVFVFDLWSRRLVRRLELGVRPLDFACDSEGLLLLIDAAPFLLRVDAHRDPVAQTLGRATHPPVAPARLAVAPDGGRFLLSRPASGPAVVQALDLPPLAAADHPTYSIDAQGDLVVDGATDIAFDASGCLVIARRPGEDFLRLSVAAGGIEEQRPLRARGYDGAGIVTTPDGRIAFWTARGLRHALPARLRYAREGEVITFRLDSGTFQTTWGRLFLDACIPEGTEVRVTCVAADEPPETAQVLPGLPSNILVAKLRRPDLTPPRLPEVLQKEAEQHVHRRETGRELPWARFAAGDRFETYEAQLLEGKETFRAARGRYLWVTLKLRGDTVRTPAIRSLRAEHPGHDLLRRLPKTYARDEAAADFLRRYLAMFDGVLGELDARSAARATLVDPRSVPPELLPWLAGFVGLVLDERWPVERRRILVEEAVWLFRFRGTIASLRRFIEIYLQAPVHILERWRLRGLNDETTRSVLGSGFRVGGTIGTSPSEVRTIKGGSVAESFKTHAHRFSVIVATTLDAEQRAVVERILQVHRPAHTIFDLCSADAGMRVGLGLLVGLSAVVGRSGGFTRTQVGGWSLGRDGLLGRPGTAGVSVSVGNSRLGQGSRVG